MATLKLIEQDETAPATLTGREVLALVGDLMAERLPAVPFDDPDRGALVALSIAAPGKRRRR